MHDVDNADNNETVASNETNETTLPVTQVVSTNLAVSPGARKAGTFQPGVYDPRRNRLGNTRGKRLREMERMLNAEHRNVEKSKELYTRLRALALGEVIVVPYCGPNGDIELKATLTADPAFMKLYLDRVYGPVKPLEDESLDLSDAPTETIEYLRVKLTRR